MPNVKVTTDRDDLNLAQLTAELGGVGLTHRPNEAEVVVEEGAEPPPPQGVYEVEAYSDTLTEQQLTDAIAAHVPDESFGKPPVEKEADDANAELTTLAQKLKDGTLTTADRARIPELVLLWAAGRD